ncbi:uncharacterized protein STEHIDRAFT_125474 [Stereum hirsutum FP-91666 SS1]|uniref:uncharacterized protein n=1 Tax=Stereum hirsutum (strain FP-91666) TaxID=721885 RepID=UPI00044494EB|nr:uncharacterized protein STEHIDRAFT_125474 [Stereum hirsutum FP-91666 SS1]EIM81210.1 hypothetical protein STEHIDRAFT_125474 [Stereum hirsutum FP-91666 SS1]
MNCLLWDGAHLLGFGRPCILNGPELVIYSERRIVDDSPRDRPRSWFLKDLPPCARRRLWALWIST